MEAQKDEVINSRKKEIFEKYFDIVEWLMLLYEYPIHDVNDDIMKNVQQAYGAVNRIQWHIEKRQEELDKERKKIEGNLLESIKKFKDELDQIKLRIDAFKDNAIEGKKADYNKEIAKINEELAEKADTMKLINQQEADLDWTQTEFPLIGQCVKNIKPFQQLWELVVNVGESVKTWTDSNINTLDPTQVE
jgi:hypothetical protein